MTDSDRKSDWRIYSKKRREAMRQAGLMPLTVWVRQEDRLEAQKKLERLVDHARLMSMVVGASPYDKATVVGIITAHELPYTFEEIEALYKYRRWEEDKTRAEQIVTRHNLPKEILDLC